MRQPRKPMGFVNKTDLPRMRRELVRKPDTTPRRKRKRRPRRIPLRHDIVPAAPVVTRLFADLQLVRFFQQAIDAGEYESKQSDEVRAEFEREAWAYLIEYLMTLEAPTHLHEPELR